MKTEYIPIFCDGFKPGTIDGGRPIDIKVRGI